MFISSGKISSIRSLQSVQREEIIIDSAIIGNLKYYKALHILVKFQCVATLFLYNGQKWIMGRNTVYAELKRYGILWDEKTGQWYTYHQYASVFQATFDGRAEYDTYIINRENNQIRTNIY